MGKREKVTGRGKKKKRKMRGREER